MKSRKPKRSNNTKRLSVLKKKDHTTISAPTKWGGRRGSQKKKKNFFQGSRTVPEAGRKERATVYTWANMEVWGTGRGDPYQKKGESKSSRQPKENCKSSASGTTT